MTTNTPKASRRARRVVVGLATTALAAAAAVPAPAGAETYGVIQCGDVYGNGGPPRNGIWPATDGSYGFQPQSNFGPGGRLDTCTGPDNTGLGRGQAANLTGNFPQAAAARAGWRWAAAPGTKIVRYATRFRARARGFDGVSYFGDPIIVHEGQADPNYQWRGLGLSGGDSGELTMDVSTPSGISWVDSQAVCSGTSMTITCPSGHGDIAQIVQFGFQALLNDDSNPQVSNVTGDLASKAIWSGPMDVSTQITDQGSGAYRFVFQRRGAEGTWSDVGAQIVNANGGKCSPIGDANVYGHPRVFVYAQPCRTNASGDFSVNTDVLPEGADTYRVLVEDAAGNRSTLIGAGARTVDRTAPAVDWTSVAKACAAGTRLGVIPTVVDGGAGIESIVVSVKDKDGASIAVTGDGTIECPATGRGPLTMSVVAKDKAGNSTSSTRDTTVTVNPAPSNPPNNGGGGGGETINPNPGAGGTPPTGTPIVPKTAAVSNLLQCTKKGLVLTEVLPSGRRDAIRGVADPKYVGRSVSIRYIATGKTIASTPIAVDGTFAVNVPAAKGKSARGNKGRYQAVIDGEKSTALKRVRRMYTVNVYRAAGGGVYVNGRVTRPFKRGTKVTVQVRRSCGKWNAAKTVRVDSKGAFGALIAVNPAESSVVVRATSRVQKTPKAKRTSKTATLPAAVQLR